MGDRTSLTLHAGMTGMSENACINVKNRSLTITADVDIPAGGAKGVILCQGGCFGGWSLYLKDGKPAHAYNFLGLQRFAVEATEAVPAGKSTIRFDFAYDGGRLAKGGLGSVFVNDKKVAGGRIERTQPLMYSLDDAADVKQMGAGEKTAAAKDGADAVRKIEAAKQALHPLFRK